MRVAATCLRRRQVGRHRAASRSLWAGAWPGGDGERVACAGRTPRPGRRGQAPPRAVRVPADRGAARPRLRHPHAVAFPSCCSAARTGWSWTSTASRRWPRCSAGPRPGRHRWRLFWAATARRAAGGARRRYLHCDVKPGDLDVRGRRPPDADRLRQRGDARRPPREPCSPERRRHQLACVIRSGARSRRAAGAGGPVVVRALYTAVEGRPLLPGCPGQPSARAPASGYRNWAQAVTT